MLIQLHTVSVKLHTMLTQLQTVSVQLHTVMDGKRGECVDPGENGAILDAGGVEGPGPPGRGKNEQLASDSGGS
jgi:hypothetical protein